MDFIFYPVRYEDKGIILELKVDQTPEEAIKQINEKHYALPFEADGRRLFKIGVNFSSETRNIEKWIVE